jgi:glycosyltransferase involved in cell wall biosynthesis
MKLLFVVHRYGADITGGSEYHCRAIAQRLAARGHTVSVATTCAADYITWRNVLPPGASRDGDVTVHRFPVARERPLGRFWELSERMADGRASEDEQREWFAANGPDAPGLLEYLRTHGPAFDRIIFFAFRYAPSWFGVALAAERAILMPTAEDDMLIRSSTILAPFFASPRGYFFNTPEEKAMLERVVGGPLPPGVTIGCGVDPATGPPPPRDVLDALGIPKAFLLYVGRVDRNKGCDALVRHYAAYVESAAAGEAILPLILAGPVVLQLPDVAGLRALGRVSDEVRDALLAHATALVMPSPYESLSLVVLEAWNRGTPVIVNGRCEVLLGQVRRADGGLYYRTSDDFAAAVRRLAGDPVTARAFGRQGLAYVEREYRWPRILEDVERMLAS